MLSRRPFSLLDTEKLMVSLLLKQFLIHEPALKKGLQAGLQDLRSTRLFLLEVILCRKRKIFSITTWANTVLFFHPILFLVWITGTTACLTATNVHSSESPHFGTFTPVQL